MIVIKNKFFSIKVKQLIYIGKPVVAIYISDITEKIEDKLLQLKRLEEQQSAK